MRICIVGTGYVGLVSGACLADVGNTVWCVDKNVQKISLLKSGSVPIYEAGLDDIVRRNSASGRLLFTTDLSEAVKNSEICFICVDTPLGDDGKQNINGVMEVAETIGSLLKQEMLIVTKSTVPVGTTMRVKDVVLLRMKNNGIDPVGMVEVANNPEFLKEGSAVEDFMKPDRVVVGVESDKAASKLYELYRPFMRRQDRFIKMRIESSELTKCAANAMLGCRVSFINEIARICERVGADVGELRRGLGSDSRIGSQYLYPGLGYGGSCLPKDIKALITLADSVGEKVPLIEAVDNVNDRQKSWFLEKIYKHFGGEKLLSGKNIAVWGGAFKADTDDIRFASSVFFIERLTSFGARVSVYDPVAQKNVQGRFGANNNVCVSENAYNALEGADALLICTEWREFRSPDFDKMKKLMRSAVIFDGRNLYDPARIKAAGFLYLSVGR